MQGLNAVLSNRSSGNGNGHRRNGVMDAKEETVILPYPMQFLLALQSICFWCKLHGVGRVVSPRMDELPVVPGRGWLCTRTGLGQEDNDKDEGVAWSLLLFHNLL